MYRILGNIVGLILIACLVVIVISVTLWISSILWAPFR